CAATVVEVDEKEFLGARQYAPRKCRTSYYMHATEEYARCRTFSTGQDAAWPTQEATASAARPANAHADGRPSAHPPPPSKSRPDNPCPAPARAQSRRRSATAVPAALHPQASHRPAKRCASSGLPECASALSARCRRTPAT